MIVVVSGAAFVAAVVVFADFVAVAVVVVDVVVVVEIVVEIVVDFASTVIVVVVEAAAENAVAHVVHYVVAGCFHFWGQLVVGDVVLIVVVPLVLPYSWDSSCQRHNVQFAV